MPGKLVQERWLIVSFGEGCLYSLVFRALRPFGHFLVMSPITPFKSTATVKRHHQK
jgi:hypothetical protein